jgi:hypothetical protein
VFKIGAIQVDLQKVARQFDYLARQDGFHVLNDWDGKANRLIEQTIPVDVLNYVLARNETNARAPGILLDYYFVYLLALLSLRVWDEDDPNEGIEKLSRLLQFLQGQAGSGHRFAENAETLIFIATSHYETDETAYERLLTKVKTLDSAHQLEIALVHSALLASHLRYGFQAQYRRDLAEMRSDNAPDYPWLCSSLTTLIRTYASMREQGVFGTKRERIVEAILNGLSPDARAFVGRTEFGELFQQYKEDLLEEFDNLRPSGHAYSPMSFCFNFPHNVIKAAVVDACLRDEPQAVTLNDLLTGIPRDAQAGEPKERLAKRLTAYARSSPDMVRGRPTPAVVYDSNSGIRSFVKTTLKLKEVKPNHCSGGL